VITCDVFCKVVDNFGDVGVSWRLARQLSGEFGYGVRLWLDDLGTFHRMYAAIDPAVERQTFQGIDVRRWTDPFPDDAPADIALEAFGCGLPDAYLERMAARVPSPPWIDVEYLSAEPWVEGCHLRPSAHARHAVRRLFFFPGFKAGTGGLLRERWVAARRADVRRDRAGTLARLGVAVPGVVCASLFCYADAPVGALLDAMADAGTGTTCVIPPGHAAERAAAWAGLAALSPGRPIPRGCVTLVPIPFLPQDDYDALLCACDLNFVRGEDSFVRGQLAGGPIVWHAYPQPENAHFTKLDAFLDRYLEPFPAAAADGLRTLHAAWNGRGGEIGAAWRAAAAALPGLADGARRWLSGIESIPDAASSLDTAIKNLL
jgi:uncharacterized repeat protein (TIGR03837 family)